VYRHTDNAIAAFKDSTVGAIGNRALASTPARICAQTPWASEPTTQANSCGG